MIEIGVDTLAGAVRYAEWANPYDEHAQDYVRTFAIVDPAQFAKDVARAMQAEDEDGSSSLTRFLDKACEDALDDGSEACEYDQRIPYNTFAAIETWAAGQQDEKEPT